MAKNRTEDVEVAPREAETPQVVTVDHDRLKTEQIRDETFDRRDAQRAVGAQKTHNPADIARKRRLAERDERPDEDVPKQEEESVSGIHSKSAESDSLLWTGRNIDQMVDFCGPDPLGGDAATFSHEWTGDATLHVYDASVGESDEASLGVTRDVSVGQYVVRAGKRSDGGWERVYPLSEDRLNRRFDSAA